MEEKFTDQYFDTEDFNLTKNDIWLRKRGESFELEIPTMETKEGLSSQYQQIKGKEKIREIFAIPRIKNFVEDIADLGYASSFEIESGLEEEDFIVERKRILEFLKRKKPDHYQALVCAGVINESI